MAPLLTISHEKRAMSRKDVDLAGKTSVVTGANSGLGLETAHQLLDLGSKVIIAVRDVSKGETASQELAHGRNLPDHMIEVWQLDLSSYDSIISFVKRANTLESLDIAILNAGLYKVVEAFSSTGYEEGIQINYLANMLLTLLLLPVIKEKRAGGKPGRIVVISSDNAAWSKFEERKSKPLIPFYKKKMAHWDTAECYGVTKLGQLLLSELAKHVPWSAVIILCGNCGMCHVSGLGRENGGFFYLSYLITFHLLGRPCSIGAHTFVHAATTAGEAAHGQYVEDGKIQPMAPFVHKPKGLQAAKLPFQETLEELSFAGVKDIVEQM
ncbi:NAD(P)-binding protein [Xylaria arbuscula]|nr:NAD(P)-binding protein [Xylaria arbuscula]